MSIRPLAGALIAATLLFAAAVGSSSGAQTAASSGGIDPKHIPIGDLQTTATAARGQVLSCQRHFRSPTGVAAQPQPWVHNDGTWDATAKPHVGGSVSWRNA